MEKKVMKNVVLGKDLENVLSDEYIVTATLDDAYGSLRISTRNPMDLLRFMDTETKYPEYSVSILSNSLDCMDPYYDLEIRGRIILDGFVD